MALSLSVFIIKPFNTIKWNKLFSVLFKKKTDKVTRYVSNCITAVALHC